MNTVRKIFKAVYAAVTVTAVCSVFLTGTFLVSDGLCERSARTLPSYAREDISPVLAKERWTQSDYALLYRQTGLGKSALDELREKPEEILLFQSALFYEGDIKHVYASPVTPHDMLQWQNAGQIAPIAPLQNGDVLVTSSCHTFGWRNGHSAIVIDSEAGTVLESVAPGVNSGRGGTEWFRESPNFLVLRLKGASEEERAEIALSAEQNLIGIPYSVTVGIFSPKDQGTSPSATHCSHLVWQAFRNFGYDIDSDGGAVCTSRDIANSPHFEVIQVFGFDPMKLW